MPTRNAIKSNVPDSAGSGLGIGSLIGGSAFIFACRIGGAALTLLAQLLLARWMGAAELGIYVFAVSLAMLLASLSTLGFAPAAMRFVGAGRQRGDEQYARSFVRFATRRIGVASVLLVSGGLLLVWSFPSVDVAYRVPLTIALAVVPFLALLHFSGNAANAFARHALGFLPGNVIRPAAFCLFIVIAWLIGRQLDATLAMSLQVAAILGVIVPIMIFFRRFGGTLEQQDSYRDDYRTWFRTALSLSVIALFTGYFPEFIVILAGLFVPSDELAVFHISFRIAMLVSFGLFAVDAFAGPEISRLYAAGDRELLQQTVDRATRLRFWASILAVFLFVAIGKWVLGWFGEEFVRGYPLLLILAVGQLVQGSVGPVVRLLSVSGHQDRCLIVFIVALVLACVLTVSLVPVWGAPGAAVAASGVLAVWALWMRLLAVNYLNIRPRII